MRKIKEEIRVVGFDDGPFEKNKTKNVIVVGVIFRGGKFLDGLLSTKIRVDGLNATNKLIKLINGSRHKPQLRVIMLNGITFGGFNIVDIEKLNRRTSLPVIAVTRKKPNFKKIKNALKNLPSFEKRWKMIKKAGKPIRLKINKSYVYFQHVGISEQEAKEIILKTTSHGYMPEPLRVAHLIATGIVRGESYGPA